MDKNKKTDELSHTLSHAHDSCSLNKNNTATLEKKKILAIQIMMLN